MTPSRLIFELCPFVPCSCFQPVSVRINPPRYYLGMKNINMGDFFLLFTVYLSAPMSDFKCEPQKLKNMYLPLIYLFSIIQQSTTLWEIHNPQSSNDEHSVQFLGGGGCLRHLKSRSLSHWEHMMASPEIKYNLRQYTPNEFGNHRLMSHISGIKRKYSSVPLRMDRNERHRLTADLITSVHVLSYVAEKNWRA